MENQKITSPTKNLAAGSAGGNPACAFTVDVEDWYQSCIDFDAPISERVVRNTEKILAVLDRNSVKGTFFVQGLVAEAFPKLLQKLVADGHEIQSHGYSHRPVDKMNRQEFKLEMELARKAVADACGVQVTAFRAPDFTINTSNLWALEVLAETGFTVDSSIFPMRTHRYGIARYTTIPHQISLPNGTSILEVPVAIWSSGKIRLPVAGGGYFRLIPSSILVKFFTAMLTRQPVIVYCHPYEFNPKELADYRQPNVPKLFWFTQGLGRAYYAQKVDHLFQKLSFGRFDQVLDTWRQNENHLSHN